MVVAAAHRESRYRDSDGPSALAWRMTEYQKDVPYIQRMVRREYGTAPAPSVIEDMMVTRRLSVERSQREHYVEGDKYNPDNDDGSDWRPATFGDLGLAIRVAQGQAWNCDHHRTPATTHRIGEKVMCRVCRRRRLRESLRRIAHRLAAREANKLARIAAKDAVERKHKDARDKITLSDAQAAINARGRLPLDELKGAVAAHFGVRVADLNGPSRFREHVHPRAVIAQILHERGCSYPVIGRCLGGRDHSTAIHMIRNFAMYSEQNEKVPEAYSLFRDQRVCA